MVKQLLFIVVVTFIVLFGGVGAMSAAYGEGGELNQIEEESFEPVGGETVELENSNIDTATYENTVDVYDNQGNTFVEGTDYEWNSDNGTIYVIENSSLAAESNAFIDYNFTLPTEPAGDVMSMADGMTQALSALIFGVAFLVVLSAISMFRGGS